MQFSEKWLREWVNPQLDTEALGHQLTMAGLEVDAIKPVAPLFSGVVVGEIVSVAQHPDADRLRVAQVNIGSGELQQIVCGAANCTAGIRVPVAMVGAVLPGDFRIKAAKLRGVPSNGMLCAEEELGLAEKSDGLMILPADAPIGRNIREYLDLDDQLIELGITPNRGDCLSIRGLAREAGVLAKLPVILPALDAAKVAHEQAFTVRVEAPAACPQYVGRVVRGVNTRAATPDWMVRKLARGGIRSINPVVDVTNYLLLELGQPMHAFDLASLSGSIVVRMAREGEELVLLDGQTASLRTDTLVIADESRVLAIAGVMGGQGSGVTDDTVDIFLESAFFAPLAVAGKARSYGLHTDSSHRFERGVDPALQVQAIERATVLLQEIAGGEAGPLVLVRSEVHLPRSEAITLREARISQLLGIQLPADEVEDILMRLGMQVARVEGGWQVTAPSWRFDIAIEVDLIEELARIHGYDNFPRTTAQAALRLSPQSETRLSEGRLKRLMVDMGWQEAITMSFVEPRLLSLFDPASSPLALANPISTDLSVMRTTLWAGLVKALQYNQNRQQGRIRLFETGLRFVPGKEGLVQQRMLAGVACGTLLPELWNHSKKSIDFFDIKGNIETLFALLGASDRVAFKVAEHPALHPGQTAEIVTEENQLGWIGRLHPRLEGELGLAGPVYLFEICLENLPVGHLPVARELSRYPEVRRDLALVAARNVPASVVTEVARAAAGEYLQDCRLFDVYEGQGMAEGKRSLAIGLLWQHPERTLQEEEVQAWVDAVLAQLKAQLGVTLRD